MPDNYIAVDLGGTNIRAARCTAKGQILARASYKTPAREGPEGVIAQIIQAIHEVMDGEATPVAIGVSAPGPLDPWEGVVINAPNLPGWSNVPLRRILSDEFGIPARLGNDANLAALAEYHFGAGQGHPDMIYFTLSTGIGGGVISGGRLLLGARGLAAELGHITVDMNGPRCNCGNIGCLEALAAGPAIARKAVARIQAGAQSAILDIVHGDLARVTAETVGQAALAGDPFAQALAHESGRIIGAGIVSLLHVFNPSIVICGGGLTKMGNLLLRPIRDVVAERAMNPNYLVDIVIAPLGDDVALLGALALAMEATSER